MRRRPCRRTESAAELAQVDNHDAHAYAPIATCRQPAAGARDEQAPKDQHAYDHIDSYEAEAPRTYMKCVGTTTANRACHFQNVYYDVDSKRFIYYGPAGATPAMFGQGHKTGDPWLRLIRGSDQWKGKERKRQFFLDFRAGNPMPPASRVVGFGQPLHLRAPIHMRSFGHFIRDNLLPMIDLPMRFGRDPVDFDWVRWENDVYRGYWDEETPVVEHYRGLFNNRPSVTWQQVLDTALAGQPSSIRYIRFREIIAGMGPVDLMSQSYVKDGASDSKLAQWAHMCDPFPFTAMREVAYRNHGLQVASAPDLESFVLFMDGTAREKRLMVNADEVIAQLRQKFPGVRMEHVLMSTLSLDEQLRLMSQATVVVSSIGSRSFRVMYLPNGASMILIGPPEYEFKMEADPEVPGSRPKRYKANTPLFEIDACWGYLGYVSMLQYHVESEAEVRRAAPWTEWRFVREADTILDVGKLEALLNVALQKGDCNLPYAGKGSLSALVNPAK